VDKAIPKVFDMLEMSGGLRAIRVRFDEAEML